MAVSSALRLCCALLVFVFSFLARGICLNAVGPTLLDLLLVTGSPLESASIIFFCRAAGILSGVLLGKPLIRFIDTSLLMFLTIVLQAIVTCLIPAFPNLAVTCVFITLQGTGIGLVSIGVAHLCITVGKDKKGPFLQAAYFGVAMGGFVGPFIAKPFLAYRKEDHIDDTKNGTTPVSQMLTTTTSIIQSGSKETNVHFAYIIMGGVVLLSGGGFLLLYYWREEDHRNGYEPIKEDDQHLGKDPDDETTKFSGCVLSPIVAFLGKFDFATVTAYVFLCLANLISFSLGDSFAQLIVVVAVESPQLGLNKTIGLYMTALFWALVSVTRLLSVGLSRFIHSRTLAIVDLIGVLLACLLFTQLASKHVEVMWLALCIFAISCASFDAAIVSWASDHFDSTTSCVLTVIYIGRCVGMLILPPTITYQMSHHGPPFLFYFLLCGCASVMLFLAIFHLTARRLNPETDGEGKPVRPRRLTYTEALEQSLDGVSV